MKTKILLFALSAAVFSSCSTAYKSGQTPDDVYYSPERPIEVRTENDRDQVRYKQPVDYEITMSIRDYRWRDFREDYNYENSPYNYTCTKYNYGYYYNPYYYPWAIYTGKVTYSKPVNTTPRMVSLNSYTGYNSRVAAGKTSGMITWSNPSYQYNNSNRSSSRTESRRFILPSINSSSSNETRTYSPSSNSGSSRGSSSGGSGSSGGSVSRPGRGG
jgi:uncharacterized membrane protein YgcG